MTKINPNLYDFEHLKLRIEQIGLIISMSGLAFILQPFSLTIYTSGFYILIMGAVIYFFGTTLPEQGEKRKAILQMVTLTIIFITIILLTIYLAPFLIS